MSTLALTRRRTSFRSVAALLAAALTGLAVYSYLSWMRSQIPVAGKLVPMIVASKDLAPGATLDGTMIEVMDHPERYLPKGALLTRTAVLGRVLRVPVFAGEAITSRKLGTRGGLSSVVPPGMRAYSLTAASGLGFVPKAGDRVDVIVTLPREVLGEPTTVVALSGKEVAAVGQSDTGSLGRMGEQLGIEDKEGAGLALTLFVTPEEAQHLAMAEAMGRITVVLAPTKDEQLKPGPIRPEDLGNR